MFNNDYGIALLYQFMQHRQQHFNVFKMQAGCRLVQNIQRLARAARRQLFGQLYTLRLTPRQVQRTLPQLNIVQPYPLQQLKLSRNLWHIYKEPVRLVHGHIKDVRNGFALVLYRQRFLIITRPVTLVAFNINIGQEIHFNLYLAVTLTRLAPAALYIERESSRRISTGLSLWQAGKEITNI